MTLLRSMSRRSLLPLIAGAALSPVLLAPSAVRAQGANWQLYRREDLGFEIEMPGRPEVREDRIDGMRSIDAEIDVDRILFGASYHEFEEDISVEQVAAAQRMAARQLGIKATRVTTIKVNGVAGLDVVSESDALSMVLRIIIKEKRSISAGATGHGLLSENPVVRRFLDSLKLLP